MCCLLCFGSKPSSPTDPELSTCPPHGHLEPNRSAATFVPSHTFVPSPSRPRCSSVRPARPRWADAPGSPRRCSVDAAASSGTGRVGAKGGPDVAEGPRSRAGRDGAKGRRKGGRRPLTSGEAKRETLLHFLSLSEFGGGKGARFAEVWTRTVGLHHPPDHSKTDQEGQTWREVPFHWKFQDELERPVLCCWRTWSGQPRNKSTQMAHRWRDSEHSTRSWPDRGTCSYIGLQRMKNWNRCLS